jgi:hypothetical protein
VLASPTNKNFKNHPHHCAHLKRQREFSTSHLEDMVGATFHEMFVATNHQRDREKDKQEPTRRLAKTRPQQNYANLYSRTEEGNHHADEKDNPACSTPSARKDTDVNTVRVRYMVNDLDPTAAFCIKYLGFQVKQQAKPNFAMLSSTSP